MGGILFSKSSSSVKGGSNKGRAGGGTGTTTRSGGDSSSISDERRDTPPKRPLTPLEQQQEKHRQHQQQKQQQQQQQQQSPSNANTAIRTPQQQTQQQRPPTQQKQQQQQQTPPTNNQYQQRTTIQQQQQQQQDVTTRTRQGSNALSPNINALQREANSNASSSSRGLIRSQRLSISVNASPQENAQFVKAQMRENDDPSNTHPTWESEENRTKFREGLGLMRTLYTWDQVPMDFFVDEQIEEKSALSRLSISLTSLPRVQSVKRTVATPVTTTTSPPNNSTNNPKSPNNKANNNNVTIDPFESPRARSRRASVATSNPVVVKNPEDLPIVPNRRTVGPAQHQQVPNTTNAINNKQVEVAIAMDTRPRRHSATSVEQVYVRLSQNDDRVFQVNNPLRGGDGKMIERQIVKSPTNATTTSNVNNKHMSSTGKSTIPMDDDNQDDNTIISPATGDDDFNRNNRSGSISTTTNNNGGVVMEQFTAYRKSIDFTDPRRTSVVHHRKSVATSSSTITTSTMVSVPVPKLMLSDDEVDQML
jgi:hypothetical protein